MINKYTKIIQFTAIFVAILVVMPSVTFAEAPSPSDAPSITDQGNGGVVSGAGSAPAVTDQGNGGVVSGGGSAPATTDQGNGGVVGSSPATPPTSPTTGGGTSSGGSSRSGGRSGGRSVGSVVAINTTPATCLYLNDYLSINSKNSEMEVIKLQAFLLNTEKLNVDINGKFDQKTFEAVKQFQKKYSNEVLTPWGSSVPTGKVFYTTKKKINEIHCNSIFPLTAQQNYEINAYKNRPVVSINVSKPESVITTDLEILLDDASSSVNVENIDDTQSGVVIKAPFTTRVYNFVRWLFAF